MSRTKFEAARELIEETHYDAARAVLRTIDHEKARDWLTKLDAIDPPSARVAVDDVSFPPMANGAPVHESVRGETGLAAFVILMAVIVAVSYFILPWAEGAQLTANDTYQLARQLSIFSSGGNGAADLNSVLLIPFAAVWAGITGLLILTRAVPRRSVLWLLCALVCAAGLYPYARLLVFNGREIYQTFSSMDSGSILGAGGMIALFFCSIAGAVDAYAAERE